MGQRPIQLTLAEKAQHGKVLIYRASDLHLDLVVFMSVYTVLLRSRNVVVYIMRIDHYLLQVNLSIFTLTILLSLCT
jgi:hypothetical protein